MTERLGVSSITERTKNRAKNAFLRFGELTPVVTLPLTGIIFLAGGISATTALLAGGIDIGQYVIFKNARKRKG